MTPTARAEMLVRWHMHVHQDELFCSTPCPANGGVVIKA